MKKPNILDLLDWYNADEILPDRTQKVMIYIECWNNPIAKDYLIKFITESKIKYHDDNSYGWEAPFYEYSPNVVKYWTFFEYPNF